MQLYDERGAREKAQAMAFRILEKPVKIPSKDIANMKLEARNLYNNGKIYNEKRD